MDDSAEIELTDEQTIEQLAGAGYGPREIAIFLNTDVRAFKKQWDDPNSTIRYHYDRGILMVEGKIAMGIAGLAVGDPAAAKQHMQIVAAREFKNTNTKLLNGEL